MAVTIAISAKNRELIGKQNKALRKSGFVPAVLYGHKLKDNILLSVDRKQFEKMFKQAGESTLIQLDVDKAKPHTVLVHDVQHDALTGLVTHVDFYEVDMTEKIKADVALEFIGESNAVKELGGTLTRNMTDIEVEALPGDLPHSLVVDISKLATFEDTFSIADLGIDTAKIRAVLSPETIIAKVTPPRTEEELASLDEQVEEKVESVEGVKKEEEEEGKEGEEDKEGDKPVKEEAKEEPKKEK